MCGILGAIHSRWNDSLESALGALAKRGPDARAIHRGDGIVLGHARLAVIDAAGGHQPMASADGRFWLIFNGEIYNFVALRTELIQLGHTFATRSDSEVLLTAYLQWGEAMLPRLDGMFAFGLWDAQEKQLFAARDRLGIKPFFYSTLSGLIFSSTLAPFLRLPGFPRRLSGRALRDYLAFQTPLAPDALLADCQQLPPGHALRYDAESASLEIWRHWSIPKADQNASLELEQAITLADQALGESVRRQLVADVPLGAFLSGGIDSSLIVRYMAEAGARELHCFSLKFAPGPFDESAHARRVAAQFGCTHHELPAPTIDAEYFLSAIADLDQPLADPSYIMTHALSRMTRAQVTVALSGDGGDELFGGYPRYGDPQAAHPPRFWQPWLRRLVEAGLLPGALTRRALHGRELLSYRRVELGPWRGRKSLNHLLAPWAQNRVAVAQTLAGWQALIDELGGELDGATMMRADLWSYLSENCLVKTDRASMAHGLEARVPLLGQPVVEAALAIPAALHMQQGGKAVLKGLCRRGGLPESVWNRPKHGFSVPLRELFPGAWRPLGARAFADCERLAPFLNAAAARDQWERTLHNRSGANRRLTYTLLVLLLWLELHPGFEEVAW
ncbi:MAG: asparagine synthase (glutamine-hydrolyzing) [Magnetococcales bacterium]|nr:asparagine synthase (glutamine-hydrolyzing) [Magnetococcales bacterium]